MYLSSPQSKYALQRNPTAPQFQLFPWNVCQREKMALKCLTFTEHWLKIRCSRVILAFWKVWLELHCFNDMESSRWSCDIHSAWQEVCSGTDETLRLHGFCCFSFSVAMLKTNSCKLIPNVRASTLEDCLYLREKKFTILQPAIRRLRSAICLTFPVDTFFYSHLNITYFLNPVGRSCKEYRDIYLSNIHLLTARIVQIVQINLFQCFSFFQKIEMWAIAIFMFPWKQILYIFSVDT